VAAKADAEGDYRAAIKILTGLAKQGCADAYYVLGTIFEARSESDLGMQLASECYREAEELGSEEASIILGFRALSG